MAHSRVVLAAALLSAAGVCGCAAPVSRLELKSLKDPYFPEYFAVELPTCAYRVTNSGDIHLAGRTNAATDRLADGEYGQYVHVHIYWTPRPGKTHANPSATNATLRYVVTSNEGVAVYSGTGFVYPKKLRDGRMRVDIESARLMPESTSGALGDFLGPARLTGRLFAAEDAACAALVAREMDLVATP